VTSILFSSQMMRHSHDITAKANHNDPINSRQNQVPPYIFSHSRSCFTQNKREKKDRNFRFMPTLNTTLCTSYSVQFLATNEWLWSFNKAQDDFSFISFSHSHGFSCLVTFQTAALSRRPPYYEQILISGTDG